MSLEDLLAQGDYRAAVSVLDAELQASTDAGKLFMAVQLKCFLQDFDGAMTDVEAIARHLSDDAVLEQFRPVIASAETWCHRQTLAHFENQRASIGALPDYSMLFDEAIRLHAGGKPQQAANRLEEAKPEVPSAGGRLQLVDGHSMSFRDVWDVDDLTGPHLVCSHPQTLLDIPFSQISEMEFLPPRGFQDTLWKPCVVKTWTGGEGFVRVFSYYVGSGSHDSEHIRMLRMTQCEHETGYSIAFGQRDWQFTDAEDDGNVSLIGIHRVQKITFAQQSTG